MEVEVNKSRNTLSNNGAARIIGFVDFREEIEDGGGRIGDMKEKDVKGGEILVGTNGLKEREKVLVVGFCRVIREKPVSGSIRQLSVRLGKIISPDAWPLPGAIHTISLLIPVGMYVYSITFLLTLTKSNTNFHLFPVRIYMCFRNFL